MVAATDSEDPGAGERGAVVALVDDDPDMLAVLATWLGGSGITCRPVGTAAELLALPARELAAVSLDLDLGAESGFDVLGQLAERDPDLPVVIATAARDVDLAVKAMQLGAYDYLVKPFDKTRVVTSLRRAIERRAMLGTLRRLRSARQAETAGLVGKSAGMEELRRQILRIAATDVPVCVLGESGTGKELVARSLHELSPRRSRPFVAVNCAAIPPSLQETELFGHEKGAFTGATGAHRGRFEQAQGGTLFLDELGEMAPSAQAAVLRTLQERTVRRVGGSQDIPVDVRIVSATHRDLEREVGEGRFRHDLFYRLVVYPLRVPPLRERLGDLPDLVGALLARLAPRLGRTIGSVAPEVLDVLARHHWPGNVRELENVLSRAILSSHDEELLLADLPAELRHKAAPGVRAPAAEPPASVLPLHEVERRAIVAALAATGGNVAQAARLLEIGRATLYRRLEALGIAPGRPGLA